jgi:hypothetical protein
MQLASHAKTTYDATTPRTRVDRWGVSSKNVDMLAVGLELVGGVQERSGD